MAMIYFSSYIKRVKWRTTLGLNKNFAHRKMTVFVRDKIFKGYKHYAMDVYTQTHTHTHTYIYIYIQGPAEKPDDF